MFKLPFFKTNVNNSLKPVALIILDGFGIAPPSSGNAISAAKTPYYNKLISEYPVGELIASGESVGLPANEVGNTEVGHLTIGAGRTILQDLKRINESIEKQNFYNNKAFLQAAGHAKRFNSKLHIMGLVSTGNVHSSLEHFFALVEFCKREDLKEVYYHLFTDGRDAPPKEGVEIVKKVMARIDQVGVGKIASITGRYYAMDRDRRWDRTEKTYNALLMGQGRLAPDPITAVTSAYAAGQTDEFIEPVLIQNPTPVTINTNDAAIFFNFRIDRPKQLTMALIMPDFEKIKEFNFGYDPSISRDQGKVKLGETFKRGKVAQNLFFVTMTEYQKSLPVSAIAFAPEEVANSLASVIAQTKISQVHLSESEKQRFVTYYFNGMKEEPFDGEEDIIIPSPKVATYDLKPEMSLPRLSKEIIKQVRKNKYKFLIANIANPDMVAHSGNLKASILAIEYVDKYLEQICNEILKFDGTVFITADHGNAEELITFPSTSFFFTSSLGTANTDHSNNPVPLVVLNNRLKGWNRKLEKGALCDVAPTILSFMKISIPTEMQGKNLLPVNIS